jgi:hypothetical protein
VCHKKPRPLVVSPSRELACNSGPLLAMDPLQMGEEHFLVSREGRLLQAGIEVVLVPETAALA